MLSVLDRARRVWRDKIAGPKLRTYDTACDELGGAPWRQLPEATDRWFLADRPKSATGLAASALPPPTPDTGTFDLRRHMSDATKLFLLGGVALAVIALVVVALAGGSQAAKSAASPVLTSVATPAPGVAPAAVVRSPPVAASAAPVVPLLAAAPALKSTPASLLAKRRFAHRRRR